MHWVLYLVTTWKEHSVDEDSATQRAAKSRRGFRGINDSTPSLPEHLLVFTLRGSEYLVTTAVFALNDELARRVDPTQILNTDARAARNSMNLK